MDFITGLPKSQGKSVIMVIVDRLTKYTDFCAFSHPFKYSTVATFIGHNCFLVWVLNWLIAHLIILNLMEKLRQ